MSTLDDDPKLRQILTFKRRQILEAIATTGTVARALSPAESQAYRQAIFEKFGAGRPYWRLWNTLINAVAVQDTAGWMKLGAFMPATPVILLVDHSSYPCGFWLTRGQDVVPILSETSHFEFSITNPEMDFVICFNAYDMLIACGTATGWLQALKTSRQG